MPANQFFAVTITHDGEPIDHPGFTDIIATNNNGAWVNLGSGEIATTFDGIADETVSEFTITTNVVVGANLTPLGGPRV